MLNPFAGIFSLSDVFNVTRLLYYKMRPCSRFLSVRGHQPLSYGLTDLPAYS